MNEQTIKIVANCALGLLVLAFVLVAWRDVALLVYRPARGLGLGIFRVAAVARYMISEAWAARAWAVVVFWALIAAILLALTRWYDESERVANYIYILLRTQEFLVLMFLAVLGCLSLPRERERKTIITTISKPLSRLEVFLGKVVGLMVVGLVMLLVMGLISWTFLQVADMKIRGEAQRKLKLRETDYAQRVNKFNIGETSDKEKDKGESIESLQRLAAEGSLFAYNYINVPAGGMQIAGRIDYAESNGRPLDPPRRWLRAGTAERLVYRFPGRDAKGRPLLAMEPGATPEFAFYFLVQPWGRLPPSEIQIQVTAKLGLGLPKEQIKNVILRPTQPGRGLVQYVGVWRPDRPDELFSLRLGDAVVGAAADVIIEIVCPSERRLYLHVLDPPKDRKLANVWLALNPRSGMGIPCPEPPRMLGFERYDRQQAQSYSSYEAGYANGNLIFREGAEPMPPEVASWRFKNVKRGDVPIVRDKTGSATFTLSMLLDTDKAQHQDIPALIGVSVRRQFPAPGKGVWSNVLPVVEKRVMQLQVPAELLGEKPEDLFVDIQPLIPGHHISVLDNSVRLEQRPSAFALNLFKSELIIFTELALLLFVAVCWSVRLGWPVATFATVCCYVLGFMWHFLTKQVLGASGLDMLGFREQLYGGTVYRIFDSVFAVLFHIVTMLSALMPDFTRYDPTAWIIEQRNIPWGVVGGHAVWMVIWMVPFVAFGYLLFRKQELS